MTTGNQMQETPGGAPAAVALAGQGRAEMLAGAGGRGGVRIWSVEARDVRVSGSPSTTNRIGSATGTSARRALEVDHRIAAGAPGVEAAGQGPHALNAATS